MFCPRWIYDIAATRVASEFLSGDLGLPAFANKYANGLGERYEAITAEEFATVAEGLLQFLAEIEAGELANEMIANFNYARLYFEEGNRPRKMNPLFGSIEDGVKVKEYSGENALKSFRAHVFATRSSAAPTAPIGWNIEEDENIPVFGELLKKKLSIIDAL